jgi:hypothetical protein
MRAIISLDVHSINLYQRCFESYDDGQFLHGGDYRVTKKIKISINKPPTTEVFLYQFKNKERWR